MCLCALRAVLVEVDRSPAGLHAEEDRHAAVAAEEPVLLGVGDGVGFDATAETFVQDRLADEGRDLKLVLCVEFALALLTAVEIAHCFCVSVVCYVCY